MPLDPPDDDHPGGPPGFGGPDPFGAFGDMAEGITQFLSLFAGGATPGAPNWDQARQSAAAMAAEGASEPNVDPLVRIQFEQLARVAELHVASTTGLAVSRRGAGITIRPVNRMQWASTTVDDYRPIFETLAGSLGRMMTAQLEGLDGDDLEGLSGALPPGLGIDVTALMGAMSGFIGPVMLVTLAGSTVGQIGSRAFGSYDLPIPRPEGDELLVVATTIDAFGEAWSLPLDDLRLYTCLDEIAHHAVLGVPHVRSRLTELLAAHADAFEADPTAIERRFGDLDLDLDLDLDEIDPSDPAMANRLQATLGNPEFMLNAIRSDRQRAILPQLDTLVACVEGYVQWVVDTIGSTLLGDHARVKEAFRRAVLRATERAGEMG